MAKKHLKRCSTLLIIREMQKKPTKRYHLIPIRMAPVNKTKEKIISVGEGVEKMEPLCTCWWGCKTVSMEISMEVPQKIKNRITI